MGNDDVLTPNAGMLVLGNDDVKLKMADGYFTIKAVSV